MSTAVESAAAMASAERIAQLKRLQRRVGGARSGSAYGTDEYSTLSIDSGLEKMPERHGSNQEDVAAVPSYNLLRNEGSTKFAAALGGLLAYIRSAETSPEAYVDPSIFRSG